MWSATASCLLAAVSTSERPRTVTARTREISEDLLSNKVVHMSPRNLLSENMPELPSRKGFALDPSIWRVVRIVNVSTRPSVRCGLSWVVAAPGNVEESGPGHTVQILVRE